jgi:serine/tyrosine/threonine adenylyltransferase
VFAGNEIPEGALPLAMAYAGHQFGHFTTLGDGRAVLLGEHLAPDGRRLDVHLKGCGRTPYSRDGDGRAAVGPMLREHLVSEAMHALGIPTTRSLAVVATGEWILRDRPLPGAVLARVASSHIRVGTFEHLAARGDLAALRVLAEHTLRRHAPEADAADLGVSLLSFAVERQASLIARWMLVGFVHGVMNTDNMALSGETIDYGPCAFMDSWDPAAVFSSIDLRGRYAYGNQPDIALWNLARLAEALLPLLHERAQAAREAAVEILRRFPERYGRAYGDGLREKLGLASHEEGDAELLDDLFRRMLGARADFTNSFAALAREDSLCECPFADPGLGAWHGRWKERLARQDVAPAAALASARRRCPAIIPRNHLVEEALRAAVDDGDLRPFEALLDALRKPYDHDGVPRELTEPPRGDTSGYRTFCGT